MGIVQTQARQLTVRAPDRKCSSPGFESHLSLDHRNSVNSFMGSHLK